MKVCTVKTNSVITIQIAHTFAITRPKALCARVRSICSWRPTGECAPRSMHANTGAFVRRFASRLVRAISANAEKVIHCSTISSLAVATTPIHRTSYSAIVKRSVALIYERWRWKTFSHRCVTQLPSTFFWRMTRCRFFGRTSSTIKSIGIIIYWSFDLFFFANFHLIWFVTVAYYLVM